MIEHTWILGLHSVKVNYLYALSNLTVPLSLLFVVGVLSQGKLLPYALAGGLMAVITIDSLGKAVELVGLRLEEHYQDLIIASRTGPIEYMLGETFAGVVWAVPAVAVYILLDAYYGLLTPYNLALTLLTAALLLISVASISFVIASFFKHSRIIFPTFSMLALVMTVLPPTFYPYTYMPSYALTILSILPTTPAAVLAQGYFNLEPVQWYMLGILIVETVVYFLFAMYLARWREK
jgi:ABC-2 type transport system permease protein